MNNLQTAKKAFTLAEVLITLGIIGVVAAITIPSVINHYRKQALRTALLKTYSELQQIQIKLTEDGEYLSSITGGGRTVKDLFMPKINGNRVLKSFPGNTPGKVLTSLYNNNGLYAHTGKNIVGATCDNGSAIYTDAIGRFWIFNDSDRQICVDINGAKGPNKYGYDYFIFYPDKSGAPKILPHFTDIENEYSVSDSGCKDYTYYAVNNIHPTQSGKDYWNDYLKY